MMPVQTNRNVISRGESAAIVIVILRDSKTRIRLASFTLSTRSKTDFFPLVVRTTNRPQKLAVCPIIFSFFATMPR